MLLSSLIHLINTGIMKKLTKEDISQEMFDLYDDYAHNKIDRR